MNNSSLIKIVTLRMFGFDQRRVINALMRKSELIQV